MHTNNATPSAVGSRFTADASSPSVGQTGVHYEIFVRSFADSNGDGIGDLNGVTSKLDYLKDLGVSTIWLMPISPSPTYHKYDVTDYYGIDPEYGTMDDFKRLVTEAHQRGIGVIIDLVLHHTSIKHPWFEEASKGPDNPYWNYYKWLRPDEIKRRKLATRDITADSGERNPWHAVRGAAYPERYYGMFWSGMPDLNFDYQPVRDEVFKIVRYWLNDIGVDGFRLDAARHLYREFEEPKNHEFWAQFGQVVEAAKPGAYTVGEVWTRPEHIAPYFRGLKANFNFDLQLMIAEIVQKENDTEDLVEYLSYVHATFRTVNPQFIDALLLSNHDQNRIGSLLHGNIDQLKVAANLLLTLPGLPYLYYGEEIGMLGMKPDEFIREPFLWDIRERDKQRTRWRRGRYSTSQTIQPLAQQQSDPNSLFNHYQRLIHYRNTHPVLNNNLSLLSQSGIRQKGVVAFIRQNGSDGQRVLVVHNLTKKSIDVFFSPTEEWCTAIVFEGAAGSSLNSDRLTVPAYSCVVLK
ncbi:alpha-amylase family glycosyl hydrolase [Spirosoma oryzicola]|uniref:alpha-amylase family glycosyl hydrolase n=1 Tax=Spirosoma oryzicola TaxID=2898794 RepID=UPI001E528102|nr:alpha-amylase family glycosyl hydrolase [Spirosoma oryzicola]UHG92708.1 alpha-amylase [Spirosoma oryzicola]